MSFALCLDEARRVTVCSKSVTCWNKSRFLRNKMSCYVVFFPDNQGQAVGQGAPFVETAPFGVILGA